MCRVHQECIFLHRYLNFYIVKSVYKISIILFDADRYVSYKQKKYTAICTHLLRRNDLSR